ncbi:MAG TPA: tyrosinase family protein [Solirubrobacterales bacterium]|nr:tyrosinase family protein [Solirubrobacterales bacterium]
MVNDDGVFVRQEARSLGDDTLHWYGRAVGVMKERPAEDVTSWWYQAAIHGSREEPAKALYSQCKHGTWFFLPWHRAYLYYWERIVRSAVVEAGGPDDWSMPYWNYGIDEDHASIPEAFRRPEEDDGTPNHLYVAERAPSTPWEPGINDGAILDPLATSDAAALAAQQFVGPEEFGGGPRPPTRLFFGEAGQLEREPHNAIHGEVGGEEGWMRYPSRAAKDPIFWLHHANIDRIWAQWELTHQDAAESAWREEEFTFFDVDRSEAAKKPEQVLDTIADLNYTYDAIPSKAAPDTEEEERFAIATPNPDRERKVVGAAEGKVTLTGNPETVPVAIDNRAQPEVQEASRQANPQRLFLSIEEIEGDTDPGTVYGVYVNLPENPDEETLAAHYAGNISFFGIERAQEPSGDEHGHSLRYVLEVTHLLRTLGGGEDFGDEELQVTFRPLRRRWPKGHPEKESFAPSPAARTEPAIEIGRVSLAVGA